MKISRLKKGFQLSLFCLVWNQYFSSEGLWAQDEPDGSNGKTCAVIDVDGKLTDIRCDNELFFICQRPLEREYNFNSACHQ